MLRRILVGRLAPLLVVLVTAATVVPGNAPRRLADTLPGS
jgi:hypothetical protein